MPLQGPNVRQVVVRQDAPPMLAAAADGYRSPRDLLRLSRATSALRPDVFFSPAVYSFYPLRPFQRSVITIHDAIAERFPALTLPSARARLFWKLKVGLAIRQSTLILTVSDYAAAQVSAAHGINRSRIRVAVEAPSSAYRIPRRTEIEAAIAGVGLPSETPYFTYVGGFSPHKRLDVILRAHAAVVATMTPPPHLVLIGRLSGDAFLTSRSTLLDLIATLGTESLVHWTDYQPDDTVCALHAGAVASLLVSESEGFGLPAVEAAASGTPVIATTESPLPTLLAGGGIFVAPGDEVGVRDAMQELLQSPARARALGDGARAAARRLTWRATARATLAALVEAAA